MPDTIQSLNRRATLLFGAGGIVAVLAAWSAWQVLATYQRELAEARRPKDRLELVAAARDLEPGTELTADDVVTQGTTGEADPRTYTSVEEVVGQVVQSPVLVGEVLRRERLAASHAGSALARKMEGGMRAVAIEVSRAQGVNGRLRRGDLVDVIVTVRVDGVQGRASTWVTETILQGVEVLDAGEPPPVETAGDAAAAKTDAVVPSTPRSLFLTLEVSPVEAEKLAMATTRGDVHVALRGPEDFEVVAHDTPLVTDTLVGLGKAPPERVQRLRRRAAPPPAVATTPVRAEVIVGGTRMEERFDPTTGRPVSPAGGGK